LKKLIEGSASKGSLKSLKVGDSRAEISAILNFISASAIMGILGFFAFLLHKNEEIKRDKALKYEVVKVKEYKEVFIYLFIIIFICIIIIFIVIIIKFIIVAYYYLLFL
jgi:hypothetical protein